MGRQHEDACPLPPHPEAPPTAPAHADPSEDKRGLATHRPPGDSAGAGKSVKRHADSPRPSPRATAGKHVHIMNIPRRTGPYIKRSPRPFSTGGISAGARPSQTVHPPEAPTHASQAARDARPAPAVQYRTGRMHLPRRAREMRSEAGGGWDSVAPPQTRERPRPRLLLRLLALRKALPARALRARAKVVEVMLPSLAGIGAYWRARRASWAWVDKFGVSVRADHT
eukprot:scaffold1511_cov347-Prasinococcus_capsulatus_cf.AAC.8